MGVAACLVSLILSWLGRFAMFGAGTAEPGNLPGGELAVSIRHDEADPDHALESSDETDVPRAQEKEPETETAVSRSGRSLETPAASPAIERPTVDWRKSIDESVVAIGNENRARTDSRASMWRQTHSIVFQPTDEFVPREQEPVLPDVRFKPEIHVIGLGVTIGSCFIGLPLVGVPVEERTVAVRLFVCASESD